MTSRLKQLFPDQQEIDVRNFAFERAEEFGLDLVRENFIEKMAKETAFWPSNLNQDQDCEKYRTRNKAMLLALMNQKIDQ